VNALQSKYYPLEVDPSLDDDTRVRYMVEWVTKAHTALGKSGLTKDVLDKAVVKAVGAGDVSLRKGDFDCVFLSPDFTPVLLPRLNPSPDANQDPFT
jgi:hypothetical protein